MKIKFTDTFDDVANSQFGIRRSHVEQVISKPDKLHVLEIQDLKILYYFSRVNLPKGNYHYLLVEGVVDKDGDIAVNLAFKVYSDLIENIGERTPLEVLEAVINCFGVEVTVGNVSSKLIYDKLIPLNSTDLSRVCYVTNKPESGILISWLKVENLRGQPYAHCAMVYCLDIDKYLQWLKRMKF